MPPRTPRLPPPDRFTLFVCRTCGGWDLAPEEIVHNSKRCPGRSDAAHIDRVIATAVTSEAMRADAPPACAPRWRGG